jgi:hypothetical protein
MEQEPLILVNNGVVSGALPGRSRHGPRAQVDTRDHVGRMTHDQQSLLYRVAPFYPGTRYGPADSVAV